MLMPKAYARIFVNLYFYVLPPAEWYFVLSSTSWDEGRISNKGSCIIPHNTNSESHEVEIMACLRFQVVSREIYLVQTLVGTKEQFNLENLRTFVLYKSFPSLELLLG